MPEKKTESSTNFEKKVSEAKIATAGAVDKVGKESKKIAGKIGKRWDGATTVDKVLRILGVILLLLGLIGLRKLILPVLSLLLGVAFVSGFFVKE